MDIKNCVELGDEQGVVRGSAELHELELTTLAFDGCEAAYELANTGTVQVIYIGEIEKDAAVALIEILADCRAQGSAALTEVESAAQVHDEDVAG